MNGSQLKDCGRISLFDGLRGLLAWWVVVGHAAYAFDDKIGDLIHNSSAVEVFVILSGFVITYLIEKQKEKYATFILRRWFRVFPVYFVLLCMSALLLDPQIEGVRGALFRPGLIHQDSREAVLALSKKEFWLHFFAHLTLLHGTLPSWVMLEADSTMLSPAWSLSVEWQFYLMAPFIVWAAQNSKRWGWLIAFVILISFARLIDGYKLTGGFFPSMMYYFLCGILSYYAWRERHDSFLKKALPWFMLAFGADQLLRGEIGVFVWLVVFATLMDVGPSAVRDNISRILKCSFIQYLGKLSYSIYLGHIPVQCIVMYFLLSYQQIPILWGGSFVSLTFVISFLMAALLHKYVERPGIALGRRLGAYIERDDRVKQHKFPF